MTLDRAAILARIAELRSDGIIRFVELAIDAALGEVARQQGGIAGTIGLEARGKGQVYAILARNSLASTADMLEALLTEVVRLATETERAADEDTERYALRVEVARLTSERDAARASQVLMDGQFRPRDQQMLRAIDVLGLAGRPSPEEIVDAIERAMKLVRVAEAWDDSVAENGELSAAVDDFRASKDRK